VPAPPMREAEYYPIDARTSLTYIRSPVAFEFIETPVFRKQVDATLDHDEYRELQWALVARPDLGAVIRGTGGLRKMRWAPGGRGKSGGVRVIYYWAVQQQVIYLLLMYAKNEQGTLTAAQEKLLRTLVEQEFG
jgi:mRNA-degrading endonuclease RelE of RelBE toxin-antitoxin system